MAQTENLPPYPAQFHNIPNLHNFRDIGGLPIQSNSQNGTQKVRKAVFYRGPDTKPITPEGIQKLKDLGVVMDFDLRSKGQIEKLGGAEGMEGIMRVWTPAFPDGEYSPEKAARRYVLYSSEGTEGIIEAFMEILTHAPPSFNQILTHFSQLSPSEACFIHCTTGNNRSGVFVAIILSFLGVSPSDIADEYSLSQIGLQESREKAVQRLMKSPVFKDDVDGGTARCVRMTGARRESMLALLETVEEKFGGAERYLRDVCKISDDVLRGVKERMVVDTEDGKVEDAGEPKDEEEVKEHKKKRSSVWDISKDALSRVWKSID